MASTLRLPALTAVASNRRSVVAQAAATVPAKFSTVKPVGERVFVRVGDVEEVSSGGILLPSTAQKKPTAGEVVDASADCKNVKAGDRVVYSKYAGTEVEMKDAEYVLLKEEDCIGLMAGDDVRNLKPLGDRLLVELAEASSKTTGGVILSGSTAERPTIGKVLAAGPGKRSENGEVQAVGVPAGASVLYSKYSGVEFEGKDGAGYIVIREGDILAVLS